ncbi:hypothetical protein CYMTET_52634 [Cymbomonas tetramitiformis]|uniref:Uncharacterized protein n=1 Tax=Cymbomonas tetramitiformis TaxID=36881 RepID=A0AAE0BKG8_9CHLO|nr:hypothetical protein CYMTET_52634 [Cymbomonas tetramitiformis]
MTSPSAPPMSIAEKSENISEYEITAMALILGKHCVSRLHHTPQIGLKGCLVVPCSGALARPGKDLSSANWVDLPNVPHASQEPVSPTKENAFLAGRPESFKVDFIPLNARTFRAAAPGVSAKGQRPSHKPGQQACGKVDADGKKSPLERMAVALQKAQGDDKMSVPTAGLRETYPFNVSRGCPGTMDSQIMRAEKSRRLFASTLVLLALTVLWNFLNPTRVVKGSFTLDPDQPILLDIAIGSVLRNSNSMEGVMAGNNLRTRPTPTRWCAVECALLMDSYDADAGAKGRGHHKVFHCEVPGNWGTYILSAPLSQPGALLPHKSKEEGQL